MLLSFNLRGHTIVADARHPQNGDSKARVFIAYSRKDIVFVDQLCAALKARRFEPLIDRSEIYAFEDWWKRIEALISRADTIVFVLSPDAVASQVALTEVTRAASLNKHIAPIVCRRVDDSVCPSHCAGSISSVASRIRSVVHSRTLEAKRDAEVRKGVLRSLREGLQRGDKTLIGNSARCCVATLLMAPTSPPGRVSRALVGSYNCA